MFCGYTSKVVAVKSGLRPQKGILEFGRNGYITLSFIDIPRDNIGSYVKKKLLTRERTYAYNSIS